MGKTNANFTVYILHSIDMKNSDREVYSILKRDSDTTSLWQQSAGPLPIADIVKPDPDESYDVAIIGGGITGLTTALLLQESGLQCVVTESYTLGYGTTGGTTSHVNTMLDTSYDIIESDFGVDNANLVATATKKAIALISDNVAKYSIDCGFELKDGYLFAQNEKEEKQLRKILEASIRAGVEVEEVDTIPVPVDFQYAIVFKNQAQLDPIKYLYGLAEAFASLGGDIVEYNKVQKTEKSGDFHTLICDRGKLTASKIVYATHIPPGINILHLRCAPYRSYVLGVQLEGDYPGDLAYDMKEPYHYFRSQEVNGKSYLIVGGEDHKTGHSDPAKSFEALENYVHEHFNVRSVDYRWSSQFYESADGLPYIGALPAADEGVYTATGFSGNGITWGSFSALLLADLLTEEPNIYSELFSPSRIKPIAGFVEFVKENADVAYHFITDRFNLDEIESLTALAPGNGMLISYKDQKLAVYKDDSGKVVALNPVCTHAKCIVSWNAVETSWDCPCHGGRFNINGKVITGPPTMDLQNINIDEL